MASSLHSDTDFDYDPSQVLHKLHVDPNQALKTAGDFVNFVSNRTVMSSLETVLRESYKFIRLADDLHEIKWYLNDIRLCFVALTISGYVGLLLYGIIFCVTRRRRSAAGGGAPSRMPSMMGAGGGGGGGGRSAGVGGSGGGQCSRNVSAGNQLAAAAGAGAGQYDEEMSYGWKGDDVMKLNVNSRTAVDPQTRYASRSLNRNFQSNYNSRADGVADSPSKKLLLENHNALGGLGNAGGNVILTSEVATLQQQNAPTRENGGIGHRI